MLQSHIYKNMEVLAINSKVIVSIVFIENKIRQDVPV